MIKKQFLIATTVVLCNFGFSLTFEMDEEHSFIEYSGTHKLHSWTGISKDIIFSMGCDGEDICQFIISAPLKSFDSGNDSRDSNMLYYTESLQYPEVLFLSEDFEFSGNFNLRLNIMGTLTFHGISKTIPVELILSKISDDSWGFCEFDISLNEFKVEKPSLLMIKISDIIHIKARIKLLEK